jgi:hypothetical protein
VKIFFLTERAELTDICSTPIALEGMDRPMKVKTNAFAFCFMGLSKATDFIWRSPSGSFKRDSLFFL